jgi:hypothetical protein
MTHRKVPETPAPSTPPMFCKKGRSRLTAQAAYGNRQAQHNRRMAEREEELHTEWLLAPLEHEPYGVSNCSDMARVKGMAQTEHVRNKTQSNERRVLLRIVQIESPPQYV